MDAAAPDDGVVVDVVFECGVLYLELANLADRPALNVTCSFDPPLVDLHGRDVAKLPLFSRVEFLGLGAGSARCSTRARATSLATPPRA